MACEEYARLATTVRGRVLGRPGPVRGTRMRDITVSKAGASPARFEVMVKVRGRAWPSAASLCIRLALTAVSRRCLMNSQSSEVGHRLITTKQQPDQQSGTTVVDVHRPQRVGRESTDIADQS